jgi:hypothetical protein
MPVIVNNGSTRTVVRVTSPAVSTVSSQAQTVVVENPGNVSSVQQVASTVAVASVGPQGAQGPAGGTSVTYTAGAVLGGHRLVRSVSQGTVGYADGSNALHGDDTVGMTLQAAGAGDDVAVQSAGTVSFAGWAWTQGDPVFLGTNGLPTQTVPTEAGGYAFMQVIGHAQDTDVLFLDIQPAIYF